ncbi:FAD:protein FMN transferase [Chitinispirillales bacterium ANBcel5]|uniref:FAD:protein FMN transferase n=1 Tax=Cellulosispirillum alkaliphilum TaxID=3039283 RepID=UPI002A4F9CE4|nr:FAD:protein FMN transferase [Chitinispirillales bacterium ANBcel5]
MKKSTTILNASSALACAVIFSVMISCGGDKLVQKSHIFYRMDTVTEITISVPRSFDVQKLWEDIDTYLAVSERRFSVTHSDSEVRVINQRESDSVAVGEELAEMISASLKYGQELQGAFDITILPIKELWGLGENSFASARSIPDSALVQETLEKVNYKGVSLSKSMDSVYFASSELKIDVGGVAKGFVVEELQKLLEKEGVNDYLIVAGGDIAVSGRKKDGTPWVIGIQHPIDRSAMIGRVAIDSGAIVTSGDYERYRVVDGIKYHHIFDPKTGYSCNKNRSVTVWTQRAIDADILSTGLFCMDKAEIKAYVEANSDIECLVVDANGDIYVSEGWKDKVELF